MNKGTENIVGSCRDVACHVWLNTPRGVPRLSKHRP